jgi:hypothetical protein
MELGVGLLAAAGLRDAVILFHLFLFYYYFIWLLLLLLLLPYYDKVRWVLAYVCECVCVCVCAAHIYTNREKVSGCCHSNYVVYCPI